MTNALDRLAMEAASERSNRIFGHGGCWVVEQRTRQNNLTFSLPISGADKSRFWPNRALWGASMKLGTIMV